MTSLSLTSDPLAVTVTLFIVLLTITFMMSPRLTPTVVRVPMVLIELLQLTSLRYLRLWSLFIPAGLANSSALCSSEGF